MTRILAPCMVAAVLLSPLSESMAAPPEPSFLALRSLTQSEQTKDQKSLQALLFSKKTSLNTKLTLIKLLGPKARPEWVPALSQLTNSSIDQMAARATKTLFKWQVPGFGADGLKKIQSLGQPVRDALRVSYKKGKWTYHNEAQGLFITGLSSDHPRVQIDSAIGLIEMGQATEKAANTLRRVLMSAKRWDDRLMAVNLVKKLTFWAAQKTLLQLATKDANKHVSGAATLALRLHSKGVKP